MFADPDAGNVMPKKNENRGGGKHGVDIGALGNHTDGESERGFLWTEPFLEQEGRVRMNDQLSFGPINGGVIDKFSGKLKPPSFLMWSHQDMYRL